MNKLQSNQFSFERADFSDLEKVFALIDARIRWMDEKGIEQWNKTDYWGCYPKQYYIDIVKNGSLFILKRTNGREIIGAVVLTEHDNRWLDDQPAFYIHNFATAIEEKGAGKIILDNIEKLAEECGKSAIRLDCARTNEKLNQYYESAGFRFVEPVTDGIYTGNKREKKITTF